MDLMKILSSKFLKKSFSIKKLILKPYISIQSFNKLNVMENLFSEYLMNSVPLKKAIDQKHLEF